MPSPDNLYKKLHEWSSRLPFGLQYAIALLLVGITGYADYITGSELAFSAFYIIPIGFGTWYAGHRSGISLALLSSVAWLAADIGAGQLYSSAWIPYWNAAVRFGVFLTTVLLLASIRGRLLLEESLADTDALTGLLNRRGFFEQFEMALARGNRYQEPFTLAYIDLDSFKKINDTMGHDIGDHLLMDIAKCLMDNTRSSDTTARLGGDEFVCIFPRAGWGEGDDLLNKLQSQLNSVMSEDEWPITFSIGALTVDRAAASCDEIMRAVDELMYSVKQSGKNAIAHKRWMDLKHTSKQAATFDVTY